MEKVEILRACPLFAGFTDVGLQIIATIAVPQSVAAGEALFEEGQPSDALHVVTGGEAEISVLAPDGEPRILGRVGEGDVVGEMALLGSGRRLATVRAVTDLEELRVSRKEFSQLQRRKPQACLKLLMAIVQGFGRRLGEDADSLRSLLARAAD